MAKILFVLTGAAHWTLADGTPHPTGYWAEEVLVPYRVFTDAGHEITIATPGGVVPPADPASLTEGEDPADSAPGLRAPVRLEDADLGEYDAVFYPGGHGPMEDLAVNGASGRMLTAALDAGKPLGVVCHGPAALLAARRADGAWPFAGRRLTAFTNAEEKEAGFADRAPWLLQDRLTELGAEFVAGSPWAPNVVVDRDLYTGQNPASAEPLVTRMLLGLG